MKVYIIDNSSFYTDKIIDLFPRDEVVVKTFDEADIQDLEQGSLVVLSGGHKFKAQWHDRQYAKEIEIIKNHEGPIIGICLGAQLIAHVYGEHLHKMIENRKGIVKIHATGNNPEVIDGIKEIKVYENHHLSITVLRKPLISIAESEDGVEVFRHEEKPIFGMQFHPEVLKNNHGERLFLQIVNSLDKSYVVE